MKKVIFIAMLGVCLSGCYMIPLALLGPASSGFTTASIMQATLTHSINVKIKEKTGKSIGEHAMDSINETVIRQSYLPMDIEEETIYPKRRP